MKSIIYSGSSTVQTTTASGTSIAFTGITRRYGCNLDLNGGNVVATGSGYYEGDVNLTFEGTAAGTVVITVYKDGTTIPFATTSLSTVADTTYGVTIPFVFRVNCTPSTISVVVSGVAVDVSNSAIVVEKV